MKKPRKKHTSTLKAQVALEAIKEQATVADPARRYKVNANLVHKWKKELLERLPEVFETTQTGGGESIDREAELLRRIGQLTLENGLPTRCHSICGLTRLQ